MSTLPNAGRIPAFTLGDRLRKARELAGYDRQQFAALIGIHRESLAKYETDKQTPRLPVLSAWSFASGVDLGWLRNGEAPGPDGTGGTEPPAGIEPATYSLLVGVSRSGRRKRPISSQNDIAAVAEQAA